LRVGFGFQPRGIDVTAIGPLGIRFRQALRPRAPGAETGWYQAQLPDTGGPALALMCGYGRLLVPLVESGRGIHGVDISAAAVGACEAALAEAGSAAAIFRQDVARMNLPLRYGCAFAADGAFQRLADPSAAAQALERIRAHLVEPGRLILDCHAPPLSLQRQGAPLVEVRAVTLPDATQIVLRSETTCWPDARMVRSDRRYALRRGAQRLAEEHETLATTWYPPEELLALVEAAGFLDVAVAPSPRDDPDVQPFVVTARL
jgi:SAM-dependent methyltransferase